MEMMKNVAMFQEQAPAAPQPLGGGAASPQSNGAGRFAELLQQRQSSQDDPAAGGAAGDSGSTTPPAGDAHLSQQAATAVPALVPTGQGGQQGELGKVLRSLKWQNAPLAVTDAATPQQGSGAVSSGVALATEGGGPVSDRAKGSSGGAERTSSTSKGLAADALQSAASSAALQGVAGMPLVTAKDAAAVLPAANKVPLAESGAAPLQGAGSTPSGAFFLKPEPTAVPEAMTKKVIADAATPEEPVSEASIPVPGGNGALFAADRKDGVGGSAAGPLPGNGQGAVDPGEKSTLTQVQKEPARTSAALEQLRVASPGTVPEGGRNAAAKGTVVAPTTAAVSGNKQTVVAPFAVQSPDGEPAAAAADGSSLPGQFAQETAGARSPFATAGFYGTYSAAGGGTEQTGTNPETTAGDAASKTLPTAMAAKFLPFQGSTGQESFADAEKKGSPEQKTQGGAAVTPQPQGAGWQTAAAAEATVSEAKPANVQSALHDSILAQIKEGVVTHDDKGNGQMSIRLNPGELGELKIQVKMNDNQLHVEVQADSKTVKDLLMSNLDTLKDALTTKNLTMSGFDVSTGGGGFNSPLPGQGDNQRQQSLPRSARAGGYPDQGEEEKVSYLTGDVNNLLDVRC